MSKTVIDMAREVWSAGDVYIGPSEKTLELFTELVRADAIADECEACAKVCESQPMRQDIDVREQCAAAIRARGTT